MYFLNQPSLTFLIPTNIKITYTLKNDFYVSSIKTNNFKNLFNLKNKMFLIYVNSKYVVIQPTTFTKKKNIQLCGLYNTLLKQSFQQILNNIEFKKVLFLKGIGFKATVENLVLILKLGYSHDVKILIPNDVQTRVVKSNKILCSSTDKNKLSGFIATIRRVKKPDPYKGKGIFFFNENVLQKEGKKNKK